ncbi:MAG TPA: DUF5659 domain-containing protein [Patescibacteria group bacterium]|nr:DUF5659 domain-containing protein [Patescibacteria group bacterium]
MQKPDEYSTKDIGEAAALLCASAKLLRLDGESNFYWFVFANRQQCQEISSKYWSSDLLVNAKSYQDSLRSLKDRLFSQR